MISVKPEWQERLLLLLCGGILAWQLFLPGFIGMANNGDFGKVAGPLSIGGADHGADNFIFFQPQYVRGAENYYIPKPPSSEIGLAWLASTVQKAVGGPARFDIRWLGALHALIFLGFYYTVLVVLRPYGNAWRLAQELIARYGDRDLQLRHYTRQRLFSPEARFSWLEPDLEELPRTRRLES